MRSGVGFDNIDTAGWGARKIPACNVPDYGTTEVADHAIGLMLALTRGTSSLWRRADSGNGAEGWHFSKAPLVRRHKGATFGIVGLGRIGLATARRAAAFDMKVVFYDPHLLSGVDLSTGYERVHSLAELMGRADVVSVHAPLSDETRKLLGAAAFAAAKPGLILINTARGPIVDLDALEAAMRSGTVAGAGLDVLPNEPGDLDHPLIAAWRSREAVDRQPPDRHAARGLLQPGVDARPQAEVDRGRACLSRRGTADQLRQCRVSEMNGSPTSINNRKSTSDVGLMQKRW